MTHTLWPSELERFPIYLRGMSAHSVDYAIIEVDNVHLYHRRDERGLVMAAFSRRNMQLIWYSD